MGKLKEFVKRHETLVNLFYRSVQLRAALEFLFISDKKFILKTWRKEMGYDLDLDHPKTLNEKIQWLILYDRKPIYTVLADKYACRAYIAEHFGEQYLVPLLFKTKKASDINGRNINAFPCIVKPNNSSGLYKILRGPDVNWKSLRRRCRLWLKRNYYKQCRQWPYKGQEHLIIVEKLLQTKDGRIPNDYKLHFMNGKLQFIYCSIDREGANYRQIYDTDWNLLPFNWSGAQQEEATGPTIEKPATLGKMIEIGAEIAKLTPYVRVDFYDVDGKLYCGEVTFYHGGGHDKFNPPSYDRFYGDKLHLPIDDKQP